MIIYLTRRVALWLHIYPHWSKFDVILVHETYYRKYYNWLTHGCRELARTEPRKTCHNYSFFSEADKQQLCLMNLMKNWVHETVWMWWIVQQFYFLFGRNQLIAVCALYSNLMLVGLNHILFYSTILLEQAGIPPETAPTLTIGIFAAQLFAAFIGVNHCIWTYVKLSKFKLNLFLTSFDFLKFIVFGSNNESKIFFRRVHLTTNIWWCRIFHWSRKVLPFFNNTKLPWMILVAEKD